MLKSRSFILIALTLLLLTTGSLLLVAAASPTAAAATDNWPIYLRQQLGALYTTFPWSGPIRDPFRTDIQIPNGSAYTPLSTTVLSQLSGYLAERDVISQIGGMGSAKSGPEGNAAFTAYMDNMLADDGVSWRAAVAARALEMADVTPRDYALYWQIGNEIAADSYSENVHAYWNDGVSPHPFDTSIIPTYVEYFFAPTVQAFYHASTQTTYPVRIALGSINAFSNPSARVFLDALLNYEISGTLASDLAGTHVYEHIDLLTVHYFMNDSTVAEPERWRSALVDLRDNWVGVGRISGTWTTEEIGINAATAGRGAGAALRVTSRYLGWLHDNHYAEDAARWFYYGPTAGPLGQQANDSMTAMWNHIGDDPIYYRHRQHSGNPLVETYVFEVPARSAWLVTASVISDSLTNPTTITALPPLPLALPAGTWPATVYAAAGTTAISATVSVSATTTLITFDRSISLAGPDTVMLWLDQSAPHTTYLPLIVR